jgi:hypothetical protein
VQYTPLHSQCAITFGKGVTTAAPGSLQDLMLIVDISTRLGLTSSAVAPT